jgi:hypothetical protein
MLIGFCQPAFGMRSDVVDVRVSFVEHFSLVNRLPAQRAHDAILPLPQGHDGLRIPTEQSARLRVHHAVNEQPRKELHPTVEGCSGHWLVDSHLERAIYLVCVLLEEHRIVRLLVQVHQVLDGHIQAVPQPQGRFGFPFPCSGVPLSAMDSNWSFNLDSFSSVA